MKKHIVKEIGLAAMCVLTMITTASAQSSFHQLTANDFWGTPRANAGGVVAYTNCTIDYRYQAQRERGGYRLNFNIRLILNNNKSWLDKSRVSTPQQMTEILKHEQGHYTIAFLEQQELLRTVSRMRFSSNYNYEAMAVFNRIDAKYKQLNSDYDEDTAHMQDRVQQHSWDMYFQKKLRFLPEDTES
ncbi:DUF922 domain-containing protein [Mucilaginibacter sp. CAU 1740]|uniref:DUF922 domain-containing protein n=1 Tax=Mucilaginibacter sp. CAU 1740 TaxID=3140365 RepID=UPI00325A8624